MTSTQPKYYRRCITITADDSPNVQAGKRGDSNFIPIPGVLSYPEYLHRRKTWDIQRQTEGLDARWFEGPALKLTPRSWLESAVAFTANRPASSNPKYLGIDPGEGGDDSSWVVIDRYGVEHIVSLKTPDTNKVIGITIETVRLFNIPWENVVFDRGGGGKEHADRLRAMNFPVRTVGFGTIKKEPKRSMQFFTERRDLIEDKDAGTSRRSSMYYDIRLLLERDEEGNYVPKIQRGANGFALPRPMCDELIRQLEPVPLDWDAEGRFKLIPKQNPKDPQDPNTFRYLIGRSPDQADAFALAVYGMLNKPIQGHAGAT